MKKILKYIGIFSITLVILFTLKKKYGYQSISRAGKMQAEEEFGDTEKNHKN